MPAPPRSYPIPRGQLSLNLNSFFANRVMTAAASVTATGSNYPQVGLYNNSAHGRLLHVSGISVWSSVASGGVLMRLVQAIPPSFAITPGTPLNPLQATLDGQVLVTSTGSKVGGNPIWRLSGGGFAEAWPYDDPVAVIPPGWSFYTDPDNPGSTVAAAFRWLVLEP